MADDNKWIHNNPEYGINTPLVTHLRIKDKKALKTLIDVADDYGIDIISVGSTVGFLMEAYEKGIVDSKYLEGIKLTWGNKDATLKMVRKMGKREGIGDLAGKGVKYIANRLGHDTERFAMHIKGHELTFGSIYVNSVTRLICSATSNRGACIINGCSVEQQNLVAVQDSLAACSFAGDWYRNELSYANFLSAITGLNWTDEDVKKTGARIFTLEKMFNYREGFVREDDNLPPMFFEYDSNDEHKNKILNRATFEKNLTKYYIERGWDNKTSRPNDETLKDLKLEFTTIKIK